MEVRTRQESRWLALTPRAAGGPERQPLPTELHGVRGWSSGRRAAKRAQGELHVLREVLNPWEGCDDGNNTSGDHCNTTCQIEQCRGDNLVNPPGETCDQPGSNEDRPTSAVPIAPSAATVTTLRIMVAAPTASPKARRRVAHRDSGAPTPARKRTGASTSLRR